MELLFSWQIPSSPLSFLFSRSVLGIDQNLTTCNGAKGDASSLPSCVCTARTRWKRQEAPLEETRERNRKVLFTHKKSQTDGDERLPFSFYFLFLFLFHACQSVREMSFRWACFFFACAQMNLTKYQLEFAKTWFLV